MTILVVTPDQTWKTYSAVDASTLVYGGAVTTAIRIGGNSSSIVMWFNYMENVEIERSHVNVGASILYALYSRFTVAGFVSSYAPRHSSSGRVTVVGDVVFTGDYSSSKDPTAEPIDPLTDDDAARIYVYFNLAKDMAAVYGDAAYSFSPAI